MQRWETFCTNRNILEPAWINVFPELVRKQITENSVFDSNIKTKPTPFMYRTAMLAEYGEFLEEIPHLWKWWKPCGEFDDARQLKATEELVDVVKFAIGYWLACGEFDNPVEKVIDFTCDLNVSAGLVNDLNTLDVHISAIGLGAGNISIDGLLEGIIKIVHIGCKLLDIGVGDFVKVFNDKYELNIARVESGYCATGDKTGLSSLDINETNYIT